MIVRTMAVMSTTDTREAETIAIYWPEWVTEELWKAHKWLREWCYNLTTHYDYVNEYTTSFHVKGSAVHKIVLTYGDMYHRNTDTIWIRES